MIENTEIERIMFKLENMEDEVLAVELLAEFNLASKNLGKVLLNLDKNLSHDEWKLQCNSAQSKLDQIVKKIDHY